MNQEAESHINPDSQKQKELIEKTEKTYNTSNDKLSTYQKWHLIVLSLALMFSMITAIMFIQQVKNLAEQARRHTEALELQNRAVETQSWQMITLQMNDISKLFIEHPDLYPYFYEKQRISSKDKIHPQVISMADMFLDFMDGFNDDSVRKLKGMNDNGKYWIAWENYFVDQFRLSPVLCARYKEVKSWYTENGVVDKFAAKGCSQSKQKQK